MRTIDRATTTDLTDVLALLNGAAAWLHSRGLDQWPHGFRPDRIGPKVALGEVWLVREDGEPIATVALTADADRDFWTEVEATEPALYMSKLAVARSHAGQGLGAMLTRWAVDLAASLGYAMVRLDAWRTNKQLHAYYRSQGWEYLRTAVAPGRHSGALFQRVALPDPAAAAAFPRPPRQYHEPGEPVDVRGRGPGVVIEVLDPASAGIVSPPQAQGIRPLAGYLVRLNDGGAEVECRREDVSALRGR